MNTVRIGVIGLGNIGLYHAGNLARGEIPGAALAAVSDTRAGHLGDWCAAHAPAARAFTDADALLGSGCCDAVVIATPPPLHPPLAIAAFARGLHVQLEKPAGLRAADVRRMNAAATASGRVFGIQFLHRFYPVFRRARSLIQEGALGPLQRTLWTSTRWYRTQDYYDSGGWRGTWKGEGGGVLMNQCPHDLDIWTWLCGLPRSVRAVCRFGHWHDLEVEDEVTAYAEFANGASGVFICSTGEFPGVNRLEIVGDRGTLTIEDERRLTLAPVAESVRAHCRSAQGFATPARAPDQVETFEEQATNADCTRNFVDAIRQGTPLVAPGVEGLDSVELANAMQLSTWLDGPVELPTDADRYGAILDEKIRASTVRKPDVVRNFDVRASWKP
jgi:predicted dehydrogenase